MFFSLYIRLLYSFSCIDSQLSFFILSVLLSTSYEPGVSLLFDLVQLISWYSLQLFCGLTWCRLPFFCGLTCCPLPLSVGWLGVPSPFSVGWHGVPAPWVALVSPLLGLTWCPRSLVDLVSPLLGWVGIPASSVDFVTTSCRPGDDISFLPTWWPQPHWSTVWRPSVDLVTTTHLVDCVMTSCRLGDDNQFGQLCDDLLSTWQRQSPSCRLCDDNPLCVDLVTKIPLPVDLLATIPFLWTC